MKTALYEFKDHKWISSDAIPINEMKDSNLVLCFAAKSLLQDAAIYGKLKAQFPIAAITLCSTAGEICRDMVMDNSLIVAAMKFSNTPIATATVNIRDYKNSFDAALALIQQLSKKDLSGIVVFSDGSLVNGSELVKGLNTAVDNRVFISGGLAGDGTHFTSTLVGLNGTAAEGNIVAIGFYGNKIKIKHGSQGGWDSFGPEREVTRSSGNVLYEIDNKSALALYIKYLGPEANQLPGSAFLFPLSVIIPGTTEPVVRTILSIDREKHSMTFAGDIPQGAKVRFMKANFDKITGAAAQAALNTVQQYNEKAAFALLVSCVGRKIILGSRIDEEVEAVQDTLGNGTKLAGFYSYGEISPFNDGEICQLHNQTMTITTFYECA